MTTKEFNSDLKKVDANYNDMPEFQMDHLGLLGKSSPDFGRDPESTSICPLLSPSPTGGEYQTVDPLSQVLEQKMIIVGKSPSPDFNNQDEETALLATSPHASYSHPLDPIRNLAYDRQVTPPGVDARIVGISNQSSSGPDASYGDLEIAKHTIVNAAESSHRRNKNSTPVETLKSSQSSSSANIPENVSSAQLLGNHYQHLDDNKLTDVGNFICQEKIIRASLDMSNRKQACPVEYSFISWNWPLIRKSFFWSIISIMVACFCVLVGMLVTVPRRCYPSHTWYQGTVFYEIFPASYQDSNGDGLGDLRGIASRASYLSKLGIQAVRLNSIFPATHYPEGFDKVTNLTDIEKSLGDFRDFQYFVNAMHEKNISVVLDFPVYPYVKALGELKVSAMRKNVADKITNVVHNHRSHRAAENEPRFQRELPRTEFDSVNKMYLKPYIDGGIAGLMKSTSDHLNSISRTVLEEAVEFWFEKGVDGVYFKGLEHYANDSKLLRELKKWKEVKEQFQLLGKEKMLMCDYRVLNAIREDVVHVLLTTMDLLDVYLDVSNGTSYIKSEVTSYQSSRLFDRRDYPWIHWNIGNVDTKRLAGRVENNFGAILFQFLLPGTISIFYGDEIGLTEIHDPHMDHHDIRYVHQLAPMKWQPNGAGFTRQDTLPWLPFAKSVRTNDIHENILSNMTALRKEAPSIYMNSIWKEAESLSNFAFRFVDENIIVLERSYPRRNAYVAVYNAGTDEARNDLSSIYYRGELLEDSRGRRGVFLNFKNLKLGSGEAFVVKLDK
ncbi:hypothetical protein RUM43_009834 [Polyplax serrata]|uniref:Glycosyl hydrolase family 13 catalytic domain-containing protein n=1 Tax=Polyplax serrata TaxID=468196 RepID=A0AAN8PUX7_POLSC